MDNQDVQGVVTSYSTIIMLGLAMLLGVIWWARTLIKKNPELTFGDIVNNLFLREKVSVFIITCFIINFAEALMAASITPSGEVQVNPLARILSHMVIAIAAITCGLMLPTFFADLFAKESKKRAATLFIFIMAVFGTIALPYINVLLIANGLKQTQLLSLYILDLNPFNDMSSYYQSIGLSPMFSPSGAMQYPMITSIYVTFAHYFLVVLDGAFIIYNKKEDKKEDKDKDKGDKDKDKDKDKNSKDSKDPITKLVKRYSNGSLAEDVEKSKITAAHSIHNALETGAKARLSSNIAAMVEKIEEFDRTSHKLPADAKKAEKIELRKKIYNLFAASTRNGEGFGLTLPKIAEVGN